LCVKNDSQTLQQTQWEESKSKGNLVESMYELLSILKSCVDIQKTDRKAIFYSDFDNETAVLFINQLEALKNAI
jgi:hypothetical protein